ncbi:MAG TPA: hypothetical protein VNB29_11170 [Chthoniobacterales bacterium]|nr:hypothetical protein [Chthoniobacterales bacterium]
MQYRDLPISVFRTNVGFSIITHGSGGEIISTLGTEPNLADFVEGRIAGKGLLAVTPDVLSALLRLKQKGDEVGWRWEAIANAEFAINRGEER